MQFYSARAYQYVRRTFDLALPTPRQIRAWYGGINGEPGFTQSAFSALQARIDSNTVTGRESVCALMLDEMAVRRHMEHVNGNYYGYVDVGSGDGNDSTPVARGALVLMVVSVNGSWKLPHWIFPRWWHDWTGTSQPSHRKPAQTSCSRCSHCFPHMWRPFVPLRYAAFFGCEIYNLTTWTPHSIIPPTTCWGCM